MVDVWVPTDPRGPSLRRLRGHPAMARVDFGCLQHLLHAVTRIMETGPQIQGSHTNSSPCGKYIASLHTSKLRIGSAFTPERFTSVNVRPTKDVIALKWNEDSNRIAVLSARSIEVVDLDEPSHRTRLDNGSGGVGRLTSAEFLGSDQLLVIWESGKAKLWDLSSGKGVELADVKTTCTSAAWQVRPSGGNQTTRTLATLFRSGADDILNAYLPAVQKQVSGTKLPTTDVQSLSWSPDGRWLAVLDTPTANTSVHIYTPDGHRFRSYPSVGDNSSSSLGVKSCVWSATSHILALTHYDGKIVLLNTRTFATLAMIEHTTTVDQRSLAEDRQAPIWQEAVSASSERSYSTAAQPVSPPLSRTKPSAEPSELGVAEACFSCDGVFLATRDERMLSTVWIWNMSTLAAYTVLIQHSNVRRLQWHPTRPDLLMIDCAEGIVYLFRAGFSDPPIPLSTSMPGTATMSWINTPSSSRAVILSASKSSFRFIYPEGLPDDGEIAHNQMLSQSTASDGFNEGGSEDSLFDVLSGRKPLPPKTEPSYTERLDIEVETEDEDLSTRVDDTFREKKSKKLVPVDPLDDSQIF